MIKASADTLRAARTPLDRNQINYEILLNFSMIFIELRAGFDYTTFIGHGSRRAFAQNARRNVPGAGGRQVP